MAVTKFPADYPKKENRRKKWRERASREKMGRGRFKGGGKIIFRSATAFGRREEGGTREDVLVRGAGRR